MRTESLARAGLAIARKVYGDNAPPTLPPLSAVAIALDARGDTSAAIPVVREVLSLMASRPPTDISVISTQRALSVDLYCLTRARRFEEAELQLMHAEASLRGYSKTAGPHDHEVVVRWLVSVYEKWGKAEQAALWKQRLARP